MTPTKPARRARWTCTFGVPHGFAPGDRLTDGRLTGIILSTTVTAAVVAETPLSLGDRCTLTWSRLKLAWRRLWTP